MADDLDMLYLIQWEDRFLSIIDKKQIVHPKKETYHEQDLITAIYGKNKTYEAVICEVHRKSYLNYLHTNSNCRRAWLCSNKSYNEICNLFPRPVF